MQKIVLDNRIRFKPPIQLKSEIKQTFTFTNPEYLAICKKRGIKKEDRPKGFIVKRFQENKIWRSEKVPELLRYWKIENNCLTVPRGAFYLIKKLFKKHGHKYKLIDKRSCPAAIDLVFKSKLDPDRGQLAILNYNAKNGIIEAPTGSGKTVMSLFLACKWKLPFCVVIDTKELLNQWRREISIHSNISLAEVGKIGAGVVDPQPVSVALMQTLRSRPELLDNWGLLIVDECEIAATASYGTILDNYRGPRVLADSATPKRKDGKTCVMHWYLGQRKIRITLNQTKKVPAIATFVGTDFVTEKEPRTQYAAMLKEMIADEKRNQLIIDTMLQSIDIFGVHLIMSQSSKHLQLIYSMLPHHYKLITEILIGEIKDKKREEIIEKMKNNQLKFIFATTNLLKKGIDEELLSVLHLVTPMRDPTQPVGRIRRTPKSPEIKKLKRKAFIFDYFDKYVNSLRGSASLRSKTYRKLGIEKRIA